MHNAPKVIWLQIDPDGDDPTEEFLADGATWCQDKINDNDVEYVMAEALTAERAISGKLAAALELCMESDVEFSHREKARAALAEVEAMRKRESNA